MKHHAVSEINYQYETCYVRFEIICEMGHLVLQNKFMDCVMEKNYGLAQSDI